MTCLKKKYQVGMFLLPTTVNPISPCLPNPTLRNKESVLYLYFVTSHLSQPVQEGVG